jgi:hypothetical protein
VFLGHVIVGCFIVFSNISLVGGLLTQCDLTYEFCYLDPIFIHSNVILP